MNLDASYLKDITQISEKEINDFADTLKPHLPNIKEEPVSMEKIQTAVTEFTMANAITKNLDAPSPSAKTQMQKLELTLTKLEHRFGSGQDLVNIPKMLTENQTQTQDNRTHLTPKLTMNPRKRNE
jgi:hypothetical protein